jgi:glycosyltransferase involved in cell wall biosynthesis
VKLLFVAHGYPPHERAGTELYVHETAQALAARGHDVTVFSAHPSANARVHEIAQHDGITVERWFEPQTRDEALLGADSEGARAAFGAALARTRPDVVHVHHLLFLSSRLPALARSRNVAVVVTPTDHFFLCPRVHLSDPWSHPLRGRLWGVNCLLHSEPHGVRWIAGTARRGRYPRLVRLHLSRPQRMRHALAAADRILTPSEFVRARFVEFGVDAARLQVLPLGMKPVEAEARSSTSDGVCVGYIGAYVADKGPDLLIDAFRTINVESARLLLRGIELDPAFVERLRSRVRDDPRIDLGGEVNDVRGFLANVDLLVVPTRLHETFSRVAREAFQMRVPVLASDSGVLRELVTAGENGAFFRRDDMASLRTELEPLVRDPERLRALNRFPDVLTTDEHAAALESVYAEVSHVAAAYRSRA